MPCDKEWSYSYVYTKSQLQQYLYRCDDFLCANLKAIFVGPQVRGWVTEVEKITVLKIAAEVGKRGLQAAYLEMERQLFNEFRAKRRDEKSIRRLQFVQRGKQILYKKDPDNVFQFLNHWLERFKKRYNISLQRKTHYMQNPPSDLEPTNKKFHFYMSRLRSTGDDQNGDIANMDQTHLPFALDYRKAYDITDAKEVWAQKGQSCLEKRQATMQLTVFANGIDSAWRTTIFNPEKAGGSI